MSKESGFKKIILKSGKDQSLRRYHPWVFSGAIKKMEGNPAEGEVVRVYDNKDEFLGMGHYQKSSIAVRVFSFTEVNPDESFWTGKIENALHYRQNVGLINSVHTNVFRLIHAEGDGLPGLIADYYDGILVVQFHSVGMFLMRELLVRAFKKVLGTGLRGVFDKSGKTLPFKADSKSADGWIMGEGKTSLVKENNHLFRVDWESGQKTGFFIDQRESRKLVEQYAQGRKVLNMFGYTGSFSVYALSGGAISVDTVDSSAGAIRLTDENVGLNFKEDTRHKGIVADAFKYLEQNPPEYDLIILDPPAFAKHQKVLHQALQGYKRLNAKAIENISPGGILFTFSCSQAVSRENFRKSVFVAAANSGRNVRILHQLSQPVDHPVNIYHPEGEYLKGLVLYVE